MFPTTIQSMDFSKSEQSTLSIRINTDGFYFSIYNPAKENSSNFFKAEIDKKKSIVSNLKELVANNPFLSQLYKRINIIVSNTKTMLHPLNLFNDDTYKDLYFTGQKLISTTTDVLINKLEDKNLVVLFGVNNVLYKFLSEHFYQPNIFAQTTCLLKLFSNEASISNCKSMFVYFEGDTMQIFAYDKGKLLLNNNFQGKEINNQIYYILYIWKQLKFSQEVDDLHLMGELNSRDQLIETIKKYIISVNINSDSEYIDLKSINL